jgi:uncharacterized protein YceK
MAKALRIFNKLACGLVFLITLASCATFKTLDTDLPLNQRMFVYSGTRLDWAAVTKNDAALKRMKVKPPPYPVVDLPFSFGLDTIFLPLSLIAAIFE